MIITGNDLIKKYKKFTDGIDKLFCNKISKLSAMIYLSNYANDTISIYEFMFILSDNNVEIDKIRLLTKYRELKKHQREKVIELIKKYANPKNFCGNKNNKRDFNNWKNQAQQIMNLLKTTVYFEVDQNKFFRLNVGHTGFYQELKKRSDIPKKDYFKFHKVSKKDKFELHHIIPISSARNKEEAKLIDNHLNLIYIHKNKHKEISKTGNKNIVIKMNPDETIFSDLDNEIEKIKAINNKEANYTKELNKINKINEYNIELLKSIFEFEK